MARRHLALAASAVLLAAVVLPGLAGDSGATRALEAPLVVVAPRVVAPGGVATSPVPPGQRVRLEMALRPSHPGQIKALLGRLYDPTSPAYHRFLPRGAFLAHFRPAPRPVARLRAYLARRGLGTHLAGFSLAVAGSARAVEAAFHVRLVGLGVTSGAATPFLLPRAVAGPVAGLVDASLRANVVPHLVRVPLRRPAGVAVPVGSTTRLARARARAGAARARERPLVTSGGSAVPSACATAASIASLNHAVTLDQLGSRYGLAPLLSAGDDGHDVTVAVYELADYSPSDVAALLACEGIDPTITAVPVDGGGALQPGGGTTEADLDLEQVATQAPGATILAYEGPATAAGQYDVWASIVGQDQASIISTSWGICEAAAAGSVPGEATLFEQAAAQGQTIVAASGDSGSEDCFPSQPSEAAVDFPASDPYVTAVGGTTLAGAADVVWNTCGGTGSESCAAAGGHATGGGVSSLFPEPSWQQAALPSPPPGGCPATSCRGVPDLVANAGTTEVIYDGGGWVGAGGTSAASPLVAGLVADVADTCAGRLGDLAPGLYAAASQTPGAALASVTSGTNDLTGATGPNYAAGPGYNLASGLGTPIATGLACPSVTAVTPPVAPVGGEVTLTGTNLAHATIEFGTAPATVLQASGSSATVVVPAGTGTVAVRAAGPLGPGVATAGFAYGLSPSAPPGAAQPGTVATAAGAGAAGAAWRTSAAAVGGLAAPRGLRATVHGRRLSLTWRRPAGTLRGFLLTLRACPAGRPCRTERDVLAPGRTRAALRLPPGRYAVRLAALGTSGASAAVRRALRIAPAPPSPERRPGRRSG